jgi:hypothetical protein
LKTTGDSLPIFHAHPRDPAHNGAQQEAVEGRSLLGEGLEHFGGGWQYHEGEAMDGCVAVEVGQILRPIVGRLH